MAEILKARDTSRPEQPMVAVKRILPHLTDDRQFVTMFLDESRVLAQLEHENIIRTLEVGQVGETPFIALEYVWGQDARMLFHRARRSEQPTPLSIACYVIAQVCAALHHAHERTDAQGNLLGLVHRDISLQNVLLSYDGAVKLTDFGIAMSAQNKARTEVGIVKGKFGYMSPEQIRGEPMDRRSDVFATGICLYELITNERLFSGDSDYAAVERVRNVAIDPPTRWNREIPSELEAIVMKALAKHPRDRWQSAADLRRALLAFMADSNTQCSATELAEHMRAVFAEELRAAPTPEVLRREVAQRAGEPTGLAAFDNLDPISTISGASAVHEAPPQRIELSDAFWNSPRTGGPGGAPSVPPPVPRRDSVPVPAPSAEHAEHPDAQGADDAPARAAQADSSAFASPASAAGIGLDWDDGDSGTRTGRREPVEPFDPSEDMSGDDEVTRQIRVGETFSGVVVAGASGVRPAANPAASGAPSPFEGQVAAEAQGRLDAAQRSVPRSPVAPRPLPQTSYALVIGIVVGIIVVIAGALYATRDSRPASVHLTTAPPDARIRVDGKVLEQAESPFVIDELAPSVPHRIEVFKDGYRGWSTRLSLEPGQVLRLPLVDLAPAAVGMPGMDMASPELGDISPLPQPNERSALPRVGSPPRSASNRGSAAAPRRTRPRPEPPAAKSSPARTAPGLLRLNSRPWSQVSIDGKPVGNTPLMNLSLPAGTHSVRMVNPQFGLTKTIKLQIQPGQTLTKVIDLQ
jgi:serine/threonine protein kinase